MLDSLAFIFNWNLCCAVENCSKYLPLQKNINYCFTDIEVLYNHGHEQCNVKDKIEDIRIYDISMVIIINNNPYCYLLLHNCYTLRSFKNNLNK